MVWSLMKAKHKNIVRFLGYCADTHGIIDKGCSALSIYPTEALKNILVVSSCGT
jgi:hypothetical protein